jgi:hypothetical protein
MLALYPFSGLKYIERVGPHFSEALISATRLYNPEDQYRQTLMFYNMRVVGVEGKNYLKFGKHISVHS